VPGYPGYEVSDQGRVRSLDREGLSRWGTPRIFKGRTLAQVMVGGTDGRRYHGCSLYRDGKSRQRTVHALVLEAFVGPRPEGLFGCHRDDDADNNCLENLYWGTPAENSRDAVENGLCWKSNISHCPQGHEYTEDNTYIVPKSGHRQCRTCVKAKNEGNANCTRTHCPQGHPYAGENLVINSQGRRTCRTCVRDRAREYQRRKRLALRR
jgi:hypothetical protein